jgi:hypothetical protein
MDGWGIQGETNEQEDRRVGAGELLDLGGLFVPSA